MFSNDHLIELTFRYFYIYFWIFFIYRTIVKPIHVIIISSIVCLSDLFSSFTIIDIKCPSNYLSNRYFVDCLLMWIILISSDLIDTETFPWFRLKIVSVPYPKQTYGFAYLAGLWKVVAKVLVFLLHLLSLIHWLESRQILKLFKFSVVWVSVFTRVTKYYWIIPFNFFVLHIKVYFHVCK